MLRRELVFLVAASGLSIGNFFSSVLVDFSPAKSFRFRFCCAVFLSVFCGVKIGLFSGNSDGGANSFRFNGFTWPPFASVTGVVVIGAFSMFSECIGVAFASVCNESSIISVVDRFNDAFIRLIFSIR